MRVYTVRTALTHVEKSDLVHVCPVSPFTTVTSFTCKLHTKVYEYCPAHVLPKYSRKNEFMFTSIILVCLQGVGINYCLERVSDFRGMFSTFLVSTHVKQGRAIEPPPSLSLQSFVFYLHFWVC